MGYARAGFEVVGVDINPQKNYPFKFLRYDALAMLTHADLSRFDAIHASPPCQSYSTLRHLSDNEHPDLVACTRTALQAAGLPYVIENVVGAPLLDPVTLCGSSFGLGVRRHRLFESNVALPNPPACDHGSQPEPIDVSGTGGRQVKPRTKPGGGRGRKPIDLAEARQVMDMPWATRREISQAIPPAYTEWIGTQLMAAVLQREAVA